MCPDGPLPTDDDLDFFHENGYWLSPRLIGEDQIAALRRAHDALFRAERDFDVCGLGPTGTGGCRQPWTAPVQQRLVVQRRNPQTGYRTSDRRHRGAFFADQ